MMPRNRPLRPQDVESFLADHHHALAGNCAILKRRGRPVLRWREERDSRTVRRSRAISPDALPALRKAVDAMRANRAEERKQAQTQEEKRRELGSVRRKLRRVVQDAVHGGRCRKREAGRLFDQYDRAGLLGVFIIQEAWRLAEMDGSGRFVSGVDWWEMGSAESRDDRGTPSFSEALDAPGWT